MVGKHKRAAGVFSNRSEAEYALHALREAVFPMNQVSIIARDSDRSDIAGVEMQQEVGNKADEGATAGAVTGTILGGMTGLLVGLGSFAFPGIGPVLLAGEIITTVGAAAAGAGIGAATGGFLGALIGLGIPEEQARLYSERVSRGDYLVIVDGTDEEILHAENVLNNRGIEEFGIYNAPGVAETQTDDSSRVVANEPPVIIVDRRDTTV